MIYTVSFNPSLDYVQDLDCVNLGYVNRTSGEKILPGGKGINVSMVLKNLGFENQALGFTAGFTGEVLKSMLRAKGVESDFIELDAGMTRINVKIRAKEETEINGQGPKISADALEQLYQKLETLQEGDILVLAGSIPESMPQSAYMDIMKRLQDKKLKIVVDATRDLLVNVLPYKPFMIKPNNFELGEIFGVEIKDKDDVCKYAKKLQEQGARNVLVSMAGDGAVLLAEDGSEYRAEAPKGTVKNSVGAGDSMVAGFIAGYLITDDGADAYKNAFEIGVCTGSASAFSEELATKEEVCKDLRQKMIKEGLRMRITDLLDKKSIYLGAKVNSKEETLDRAVALMAESEKIADVDTYRKGVYAREQEGTTGIGEGIAIPHCKSAAGRTCSDGDSGWCGFRFVRRRAGTSVVPDCGTGYRRQCPSRCTEQIIRASYGRGFYECIEIRKDGR